MSAAFSGPALAFCGYSGSGKTELLLNCLNLLKERGFSPAVLKTSSEVHAEIASKDSQRFFDQGAALVSFTDPAQVLLHLPDTTSRFETTEQEAQLRRLVPFDLLLREGGKQSKDWKVVCIHPKQGIPDLDTSRILAFWTGAPGSSKLTENKALNIPCFGPGEEIRLLDHCLEKLRVDLSQNQPLKGVVLVGGKSTRMGQPKAWLPCNGSPMALQLAKLLEDLLGENQVFFGGEPPPFPANLPVAQRQELERYAVISDRVGGFGPWGGLLGLWEAEPKTSWLVLGCDYPRLTIDALSWLLSQRDPLRPATLACHQDGLLETMVGIYEPAFRYLLEGAWLDGGKRMNRRMQQWPLHTLQLPQSLQSCWQGINTPSDLELLIQQSSAQQ
ncbi:MAG: molybdopterin-guanine dinucleotide biosynthesis protein MobB [Deltaproteobacteria bacterium]